jgi:toxin ParE1/3/4
LIVRIHPEAAKELTHSVKWYFEQSQSAAANFLNEIERCISKITESPEIFPQYFHGSQRAIVKTFPYSVIFRIKMDTIEIIAIAHAKRRPGYWRRREKKSV